MRRSPREHDLCVLDLPYAVFPGSSKRRRKPTEDPFSSPLPRITTPDRVAVAPGAFFLRALGASAIQDVYSLQLGAARCINADAKFATPLASRSTIATPSLRGDRHERGRAGSRRGWGCRAHAEPSRPAQRYVGSDAGRLARGAAPAGRGSGGGRGGTHRGGPRLLRRRRREGDGRGARVRWDHARGEGAGASFAHGRVAVAP